MSNVDQILRNLLDQIATEQTLINHNVIVKPISSGGANYTSQLFLATITSDNEADLHVFAKVAALGDKMRSEVPFAIYEVERKTYTVLSKIYQDLEEKHNVPDVNRLKMPKIYGCNPNIMEETLVLEDLTAQGFKDYSRFKSVDWPYASKAIEELAKLHALSFAYSVEQPDEFDKIANELSFDFKVDDEQKVGFWNQVLFRGVDVVCEENRERLREFVKNLDVLKGFKEYTESKRRNTLVHRDFRVSNLMHKVNDDGTLEVKIVDYQTIQAGSPVIDLLYFIFTGSDEEFRLKHYDQLIDHYYTELNKAMQRLDLRPDEIYSREDFDSDLKEKLPFTISVAICTLPLVTVEAQNAPKVDENMDITSFKIEKTSDLFTERLNGIVNDYIRWGIL